MSRIRSYRSRNRQASSPSLALTSSAPTPSSRAPISWSLREVGLGEGDVTVVASADATADYACLNRGGEFPNDPKKQSISGPVSATGVFPVAKNGHIEGTLTVLPPAST